MVTVPNLRGKGSGKKKEGSEVVNYSDEYAFCIGEIGLSKEEYWSLTPAETYTKVKGYLYNRDVMSANFRALFALSFNQFAKPSDRKSAAKLWPLSIDQDSRPELSASEMYERNRKIIAENS